MCHDHLVTSQRELLDFRNEVGQLEAIRVADHRFDRRNRLEFGEEFRGPDIACVQDQINALEPGEDFWTELSVRIADETYAQAYPVPPLFQRGPTFVFKSR